MHGVLSPGVEVLEELQCLPTLEEGLEGDEGIIHPACCVDTRSEAKSDVGAREGAFP
jgi:hypothetical protein